MQRKMNKYVNIANIVIVLFILTTLGDVVSTLMATQKHSDELEVNPLAQLNAPMWVLLLGKLILMGLALWYILVKYSTLNVHIRFYWVLFLVFITLLQLAVTVNNFQGYSADVGTIQPIPKEQRTEFYMEQVGDAKIMQTIEPPTPVKIPSILYTFLFIMTTFVVWVSFERKYNMELI